MSGPVSTVVALLLLDFVTAEMTAVTDPMKVIFMRVVQV